MRDVIAAAQAAERNGPERRSIVARRGTGTGRRSDRERGNGRAETAQPQNLANLVNVVNPGSSEKSGSVKAVRLQKSVPG